MVAGEPGDCEKIKLTEDLEVSLWDRWDIHGEVSTTFQNVITHIESTYKGLEVRDILFGSKAIFLHALMSAPGQEKSKKKILDSTVHLVTDCEIDDSYIDIGVTCVRKDDEKAEILKGVPPVRVFFGNGTAQQMKAEDDSITQIKQNVDDFITLILAKIKQIKPNDYEAFKFRIA